MRLANVRAHQQIEQPGRTDALSGVGSRGVHRRVEGGVGPGHGVEGQGADHVDRIEQPASVGNGQRTDCGGRLGAVDQRETLFGLEVKGFESGRRECPAAGKALAV